MEKSYGQHAMFKKWAHGYACIFAFIKKKQTKKKKKKKQQEDKPHNVKMMGKGQGEKLTSLNPSSLIYLTFGSY